MKRLSIILTCLTLVLAPATTVYASSLDDVISGNTGSSEESTGGNSNNSTNNNGSTSDYMSGEQYMDEIKDAVNLSKPSAGATKLNEGIKKVASFIVQVASYALTAFLVVRIVLDLLYITLPFTRSILANGYAGNPAATEMQQPGMMGGMGMGGMGGMGSPMGGMGMGGMGGYGRGRYGMGGMGMGAMGGMGMGGMQGGMMGQQGMGQPGATPAMGRVQIVSHAALNAVLCEQQVGPDGKNGNALAYYAKDMTGVLIITPILLTLAVTGVLVDFGFLIGDVLARAIASIGNML